jgi:hypothetical protein
MSTWKVTTEVSGGGIHSEHASQQTAGKTVSPVMWMKRLVKPAVVLVQELPSVKDS